MIYLAGLKLKNNRPLLEAINRPLIDFKFLFGKIICIDRVLSRLKSPNLKSKLLLNSTSKKI